jgi:predicted nucleotidyltransferase
MKIKAELPESLVEIAILTLKNRLLKELGNVIVSIVFFGSRYRGRFIPDSDIDILIIGSRNPVKSIDSRLRPAGMTEP